MKVAFVASEAIPYAKTGGLADVAGTLPVHLRDLGIRVLLFLPRYKGIKGVCADTLYVDMDTQYKVGVYAEGDVCFIDYPDFFERNGLYGTEKGDFSDNGERFALFCKAVTQLITKDHYDVVHCHDWQTGLIPLYLKAEGVAAKSVFTIHNLGYQGIFPQTILPMLGLGKKYFNPEGIEFYGDVNYLKAGIVYSDVVTTVSANYSKEIQRPELGFGLDGILRKRKDKLIGIINGIDYNQWNPATDDLIFHKYTHFEGKQKNKAALARACHIDTKKPLIGMVSRIADQKGFDIIMKVFHDMIHMGYNFILLGFGEEKYHKKLKNYESTYPRSVSINIRFDNKLAHRIYAGSDFFLMPSRYEPCGLGQLISLKYGTVPIVRSTGGLADTVADFDPSAKKGNGFLFREYSGQDLLNALSRGLEIYYQRDMFRALSENCMKFNFSWEASAVKYRQLYESL